MAYSCCSRIVRHLYFHWFNASLRRGNEVVEIRQGLFIIKVRICQNVFAESLPKHQKKPWYCGMKERTNLGGMCVI